MTKILKTKIINSQKKIIMKTKNEKSWLYNFMMELILETNPGFDLKCQIRKLESDLKEQSDKTAFYYADNKRLYGENSDLRKKIIEKTLQIFLLAHNLPWLVTMMHPTCKLDVLAKSLNV
jgi:hypothetical protein